MMVVFRIEYCGNLTDVVGMAFVKLKRIILTATDCT